MFCRVIFSYLFDVGGMASQTFEVLFTFSHTLQHTYLHELHAKRPLHEFEYWNRTDYRLGRQSPSRSQEGGKGRSAAPLNIDFVGAARSLFAIYHMI